jgi:hypothetical protein
MTIVSFMSLWVDSTLIQHSTHIGLAHNLAKYFGDDDAVPFGMCGSCTFCKMGQSVEFIPEKTTTVDPNQIHAILRACPERDDPRLLARMAFGITSPRLTINKWSTSHALFGSMDSVDFSALVQAFEIECKMAGYQKSETATAVATQSTKRPRTQSSSYISKTNYGRDGGYKRARRY